MEGGREGMTGKGGGMEGERDTSPMFLSQSPAACGIYAQQA